MRAAILLTVRLALAACRAAPARTMAERGITLPGTDGDRDFQVGGFDKIALAGPHDVVVTVGGARLGPRRGRRRG